jgi:hypothetical protein
MNHVAVGIAWLSGAALVAFGVHGCGKGHDVYGWAVFAGIMLFGAKATS